MQRGLSSTGLLPIAVIFSIYIKGRWLGMKAGHPKRTAHRGQTWGLIKTQPSQAQTGFEVRHIKSRGSKVRHRTDLHLTLQLEMVISRCNDDPCLTVRDDTTVGDTRHMCECVRMCVNVCVCVLACVRRNDASMHLYPSEIQTYIIVNMHVNREHAGTGCIVHLHLHQLLEAFKRKKHLSLSW